PADDRRCELGGQGHRGLRRGSKGRPRLAQHGDWGESRMADGRPERPDGDIPHVRRRSELDHCTRSLTGYVSCQEDNVTVVTRPTRNERDAYRLLYAGFVAAPLIAGFDKFTDKLGNWDRYLADGVA